MAAKSVSAIFATEIEASKLESSGRVKKGKKGSSQGGAKKSKKKKRHIIVVVGKGGPCKGTPMPDGTTVWVCSPQNK